MPQDRSRRLSAVFEAQTEPFRHLEGTTQRVYITEMAADGHHLVGHTKCYTQVLISPDAASLGADVYVCVTDASSKWSVRGVVVSATAAPPTPPAQLSIAPKLSAAESKTTDKGCGADGDTPQEVGSIGPWLLAAVGLGFSLVGLALLPGWRRSR